MMNSNNYSSFASVYDRLMSDVDYDGICEGMLKICEKHGHTPKYVLDAACGTGSFTRALVERGLDVIGADCSPEMLEKASERLSGLDCLLLCQDICELDLYGKIDTAFCTLDGFNHIINKTALKKALRRISLFTERGGMLIFDVNTVYKHQKVLADNTFVIDDGDVYVVWQNFLCKNNIVNINLDFFVDDGDGKYHRFNENFDERAYSDAEICEMLAYAGYKVVGRYDFDSFGKSSKTSEKIIYAAKKI